MKYDKVRKNPSQLLCLTGFTFIEFDAFLPTFKHHWDEYYSHFTLRGNYESGFHIIERVVLPLAGVKLLFILSYMKNNPLQDTSVRTNKQSKKSFSVLSL